MDILYFQKFKQSCVISSSVYSVPSYQDTLVEPGHQVHPETSIVQHETPDHTASPVKAGVQATLDSNVLCFLSVVSYNKDPLSCKGGCQLP